MSRMCQSINWFILNKITFSILFPFSRIDQNDFVIALANGE